MLDEMTPEQLVEWRAAIEVVGVDGLQRQIARLTQYFLLFASSFGDGKTEGPTEEQVMGLLMSDTPQPQPVQFESGEALYAKFKQAFG